MVWPMAMRMTVLWPCGREISIFMLSKPRDDDAMMLSIVLRAEEEDVVAFRLSLLEEMTNRPTPSCHLIGRRFTSDQSASESRPIVTELESNLDNNGNDNDIDGDFLFSLEPYPIRNHRLHQRDIHRNRTLMRMFGSLLI